MKNFLQSTLIIILYLAVCLLILAFIFCGIAAVIHAILNSDMPSWLKWLMLR